MPYETIKSDFNVYDKESGTYVTHYNSTIAEQVKLASGSSVEAALGSVRRSFALADIDARDAVESPQAGDTALVSDASGDSTVASGWAFYFHDGTSWIKAAEQESQAIAEKFGDDGDGLTYDGAAVALGPVVIISDTEPDDQPEGGIWLKPTEEE
jgi:predicted RNA-binding protein with TRAM domain